jgi:hypothetical protein
MAADERRDALVERLFEATLGTWDLLAVYLGGRLGLYRALADRGAMTAPALGEATGTNERYIREWLEQQAATEILEVDDAGKDPAERRYSLPAGHDEAFETGDGVPYAVYGDDLHEGQAEFTRPMFDTLLGSEWLPSIPDVHERLESDPLALVTDVACGQGFSSIAIAWAYPKVHVDGVDSDEASIAAAERNLKGSGVEDRMLHCHPVGMVGEGAAGTGTVMRAATVRRYADEAGFQGFEVLPIENDFYRFYRLEP